MGYVNYLRKKEKRKQNIIKFLKNSFILVQSFIIFSSAERVFCDHLTKSPYDGNNICISPDILEEDLIKVRQIVDEELTYDEIKNYIKNNMGEDEKKNNLLLYSLVENKTYKKEDIKSIYGYLQYLNDNKYIDYEKTYKILKTSLLLKDVDIFEENIAGKYIDFFNTIVLEDNNSLGHELFHNEDMYIWKNRFGTNNIYLWFVEGSAEVLFEEYIDSFSSTYPIYCSAVRILAEMVGIDNIFKVRSTGNFDYIINYFVNKNINTYDIYKLFDDLNSCLEMERNNENTQNIRMDICSQFINLYNNLYNNPEVINPTFVYNLENIRYNTNCPLKISNYYIFNSLKKEKNTNLNISQIFVDNDGQKYCLKKTYNNDFITLTDENNNLIKKYYYDQSVFDQYNVKQNLKSRKLN